MTLYLWMSKPDQLESLSVPKTSPQCSYNHRCRLHIWVRTPNILLTAITHRARDELPQFTIKCSRGPFKFVLFRPPMFKVPEKIARWSFHWHAGKTQDCAHTHARASVSGRKMVWVHSHPHWRWDRRCPLSDHWLIVTNNSQPHSTRNPKTCTNLWHSRRLVWLLDTAPTSVGYVVVSVTPIHLGKLAASDKDAISHWIRLSEQLLEVKNILLLCYWCQRQT